MQALSAVHIQHGLGARENLNEPIVGEGRPAVGICHEMLSEAIDFIVALLDDGNVNDRGTHFDVEPAKLRNLPATLVAIGVAVSGNDSCALAEEQADILIATEPKLELGQIFGRIRWHGQAPRRPGRRLL